jgi:hypothetical protein
MQGLDDGIEEEQEQEQEHAILVIVQRAIARAIALAPDVVQAAEQGRKLIEILEALKIFFANLRLRRGWPCGVHGVSYDQIGALAQFSTNELCWRKFRAEHHWLKIRVSRRHAS